MSDIITAFMTDDSAARKVIDKYTDPFVEDVNPYIDMLRLEGNPWTSGF